MSCESSPRSLFDREGLAGEKISVTLEPDEAEAEGTAAAAATAEEVEAEAEAEAELEAGAEAEAVEERLLLEVVTGDEGMEVAVGVTEAEAAVMDVAEEADAMAEIDEAAKEVMDAGAVEAADDEVADMAPIWPAVDVRTAGRLCAEVVDSLFPAASLSSSSSIGSCTDWRRSCDEASGVQSGWITPVSGE